MESLIFRVFVFFQLRQNFRQIFDLQGIFGTARFVRDAGLFRSYDHGSNSVDTVKVRPSPEPSPIEMDSIGAVDSGAESGTYSLCENSNGCRATFGQRTSLSLYRQRAPKGR